MGCCMNCECSVLLNEEIKGMKKMKEFKVRRDFYKGGDKLADLM